MAIGSCSCRTKTAGLTSIRFPRRRRPRRHRSGGGNGPEGKALLLTPGPFMVEFVSLTPDRKFVIYNANTGGDKDDIERRHLFKVPVGAAQPVALTRGTGHRMVAGRHRERAHARLLRGRRRRSRRCRTCGCSIPSSSEGTTGAATRALAADQVPKDFPTAQLVTPEHVTFKAPDGTTVHGQLFMPPAGAGRKRGRERARARHRARASPRWCSRTAVRRGRCCLAGTTASTTRTRTR